MPSGSGNLRNFPGEADIEKIIKISEHYIVLFTNCFRKSAYKILICLNMKIGSFLSQKK